MFNLLETLDIASRDNAHSTPGTRVHYPSRLIGGTQVGANMNDMYKKNRLFVGANSDLVAFMKYGGLGYLIRVWRYDYESHSTEPQIVEVSDNEYHYLFDLGAQRLIVGWGYVKASSSIKRDGRQSKIPMRDRPLYESGHSMPHCLGGGLDINIVPQLKTLNRGKGSGFAELERKAMNAPGAFYFTYWIYRDKEDQTPCAVDQGLIIPGEPVCIETWPN